VRLDAAPGERGLAGVLARQAAAFDDQHVWSLRTLAEQDEDGTFTTALSWGDVLAQVTCLQAAGRGHESREPWRRLRTHGTVTSTLR
jgi:hypothetical protein